MFKVLSSGLWQRVRAVANKAPQRQAVIAFVTADLIGFKAGDLLITDASEVVIRSGATDARLLLKLHRRGVTMRSCPNLHAKVLLLGDVAVVGSNNLSASSRDRLVEAAILTDSSAAVSGVASLIEQLRRQSKELKLPALQRLARIKVERRGFIPGQPSSRKRKPKVAPLGKSTWLVGVVEFDRELDATEKRATDEAQKTLAKSHGADEDSFTWIRWAGKGPFATRAQHGDRVIQIWRKSDQSTRPSVVLRETPILLRKRIGGSTFVFMQEPSGRKSEITWGAFQRLMRQVGYRRRFGKGSEVVLPSVIADGITQGWRQV